MEKKNKRILYWIVVGCVLLFAFAGGFGTACLLAHAEVVKTWRTEHEIASQISRVARVLEHPREAYGFGFSLCEKIATLVQPARRIYWYRRFSKLVFELEKDQIVLYDNPTTMSSIDEFLSPLANAWYNDGMTTEESWYMRIDRYGLRKRQIERWEREKAELEQVLQKPDPSVSRSDENHRKRRLRNLTSMIYNGTAHIDLTIGRWEHDFHGKNNKLSPEGKIKVARRFEKVLGRQIRTPEQIEADRRKRAEAYRIAEEAAQRQREKDRENNAKVNIDSL